MQSRRDILKLSAVSAFTAAAMGKAPSWEVVQPEAPKTGELPKPLPRVARFERMAFGMFVHWGLYSQLGKGEWAKKQYSIGYEEYSKLLPTFTASEFSGRELAKVAKSAGMKYVTLTSRHHDGFSLYDTRGLSTYDVTHTPARRDLILDFVTGCREEGIVPMLYCTTLDWTDKRFNEDWDGYLKYLRDSIEILCTHYGELGGFWFDGNWSKPNADWKEAELYSVIRRLQPEAMIINNTGIDAHGVRGNPEIDSTTFERGRPQPVDRRGWPKHVAGEMCHTLNFHWGIGNKDFNYLSPAHVIEEFCRCRRAGANLLLNVGPTASGRVPDYERALLARVGDWVREVGGPALYDGRPEIFGDEDDFGLVTTRADGGRDVSLYCFGLTPTADTRVHQSARGFGKRSFKGVPAELAGATWADNGEAVSLSRDGDKLVIDVPKYREGANSVVRAAHGTLKQ